MCLVHFREIYQLCKQKLSCEFSAWFVGHNSGVYVSNSAHIGDSLKAGFYYCITTKIRHSYTIHPQSVVPVCVRLRYMDTFRNDLNNIYSPWCKVLLLKPSPTLPHARNQAFSQDSLLLRKGNKSVSTTSLGDCSAEEVSQKLHFTEAVVLQCQECMLFVSQTQSHAPAHGNPPCWGVVRHN